MLSNYFKIALRQLRTKPLYTGLNITGLSLGVAAGLLITLYLAHEFSYDRWNPHADRIVRVAADINFAGHHYELVAKTAETTQKLLGTTSEEMAKTGEYARFYLQNLTDIHLHSDLTAELQPNGSIRYILCNVGSPILPIALICSGGYLQRRVQ